MFRMHWRWKKKKKIWHLLPHKLKRKVKMLFFWLAKQKKNPKHIPIPNMCTWKPMQSIGSSINDNAYSVVQAIKTWYYGLWSYKWRTFLVGNQCIRKTEVPSENEMINETSSLKAHLVLGRCSFSNANLLSVNILTKMNVWTSRDH